MDLPTYIPQPFSLLQLNCFKLCSEERRGYGRHYLAGTFDNNLCLERFGQCNSGHLMLASDYSEKPRHIIVNLYCLCGIFQKLEGICGLLVVHFNGQATPRINLRPKCLISPTWLGGLSSLDQDSTPQLTLFRRG